MADQRIPVLEIFGPTIQGEGMVIGQKTMFVRTAGCDYACIWCDSAFTWDGSAKEEIRLLTAEEIVQELFDLGGDLFGHVTLSGGNPALLKDLGTLVDLLHEHGIVVALETQGSRWQEWFIEVDDLTLSPKPPSSNMKTDWAILDEIVSKCSNHNKRTSLKVVVFDDMDLQYAAKVHQRYPEIPMYLQVGNEDVKGNSRDNMLPLLLQRYEWLIDCVMQSNQFKQVRVLPQLHTWLWGNKRGV